MSALRDILVGAPGDAPPSAPPQPQPLSLDRPVPVPSTASAGPSAASPPTTSAPNPHAPAEPAQTTDQEHGEERTSGILRSKDYDKDIYPYGLVKTGLRANPAAAAALVHGNRIKHLKKEDGIPLWRKDIQFDFLDLIFHDTTRCFTLPNDDTRKFTFAEVYVDAMANSSKCSKTLAGKLMEDLDNSLSMAMVCLLVNIGRMNTTLNFFPEMRAQLRTYHAIPALQAHQDAQAYKQLQDAPRLKSILKGAAEDTPQAGTIEELRSIPRPRTNPVNLIFVMAQYSPKVTELHFEPPVDFFDLIMRTTLSSKSRARAFLWLIWWYMESDFTYEDSQGNPFGPGQFGEGEHGPGAVPEKVPAFESLTEEQAKLENVDTDDELYFGEVKRNERTAILGSEPSPAMTALKRARKEKGLFQFTGQFYSDDERSEAGWNGARPAGRSSRLQETGSEYTRSPSPGHARGHASSSKTGGDMHILDLLNMDATPAEAAAPAPAPKKGPGRGNWRRNKVPKADASAHVPLLPINNQLNFVNEGPSTPGSFPNNKHGSPSHSNTITFTNAKGEHVPTPSYQQQKRTRGITQHQSAVINHRKRQIEYTLDRRIRRIHARAEEQRDNEGSIIRAWKRIRQMPVDYDSEEEMARAQDREEERRRNQRGKDIDLGDDLDGGPGRHNMALTPLGMSRAATEPDTVGEEAQHMFRTFKRAFRRLDRWDESTHPAEAMMRRKQLAAAGTPLQPTKKRHTYPPDDENDALEDELKAGRSSVGGRGGRKRGGRGGGGVGRAAKATKQQVDDDMGDMDDEEREMIDAGDDDDEMDED